MPATTEYLYEEGTMKLPEFDHDIADGLAMIVSATLSEATITAGDFTLTLNANVPDLWPAAGHFFVNGRLYTYASKSGVTLIDCNGPFGDALIEPIVAGDVISQALSATVVNALLAAARGLMTYKASAQTGRAYTVAPGRIYDPTTQLILNYAGATATAAASSTTYVAIYNNAGTATVAVSTTSFAALQAAVGEVIYPLAIITADGSTITDITDCRGPSAHGLALVAAHADLSGLGADDHTQYALLAGRAGGQTLIGDTAAFGDLILMSTSDSGKGRIVMTGDNAATDTVFESTGQLTFYGRGGPGTSILGTNIGADTHERFGISAAGSMYWGAGSGATDIDLGRIAAGLLGLSPAAGQAFHAGIYLRLDELGVAPTPVAAMGIVYVDTDGRAKLIDADGNEHDLAVQQSVVFVGGGGLTTGSEVALHHATGKFPATAMNPAVVGATVVNSFTLPTGAGFGTLGDAHARYSWTSTNGGAVIGNGAQVCVGGAFRRYGAIIVIDYRIRINVKNRLSRLDVSANDTGANSSTSGSLLASMSDNTWYDGQLIVDAGAWADGIRICLTAQGTSNVANAGSTILDIEHFVARVYAN